MAICLKPPLLLCVGLAGLAALSPAHSVDLAVTAATCSATYFPGNGTVFENSSPKADFLPVAQSHKCKTPVSSAEGRSFLLARATAATAEGKPNHRLFSTAEGGGELHFQAVVGERTNGVDPPFETPDGIPIIYSVNGQVHVTKTRDALVHGTAEVRLLDDLGKELFRKEATIFRGPFDRDSDDFRGFRNTVADRVNVGRTMFVRLSSGCTGRSGLVGSFSCTALADPTFAFDQETFDATNDALGLPSFRLEDYYTFEFSPNLILSVGAVPEPSSIVLLFTGLAMLMSAFARRSRVTRFTPST